MRQRIIEIRVHNQTLTSIHNTAQIEPMVIVMIVVALKEEFVQLSCLFGLFQVADDNAARKPIKERLHQIQFGTQVRYAPRLPRQKLKNNIVDANSVVDPVILGRFTGEPTDVDGVG